MSVPTKGLRFGEVTLLAQGHTSRKGQSHGSCPQVLDAETCVHVPAGAGLGSAFRIGGVCGGGSLELVAVPRKVVFSGVIVDTNQWG